MGNAHVFDAESRQLTWLDAYDTMVMFFGRLPFAPAGSEDYDQFRFELGYLYLDDRKLPVTNEPGTWHSWSNAVRHIADGAGELTLSEAYQAMVEYTLQYSRETRSSDIAELVDRITKSGEVEHLWRDCAHAILTAPPSQRRDGARG